MKYRLPELDVPSATPFENDSLDREPLVKFLSGLIGRLGGPFVLALDSPWGTGKTTLVKMLKAQLELEDFQCIYFNAWQVDYVTDPLVAMVAALDALHFDNDVAETAFRSQMKAARKITSTLAKRAFVAGVKAATLNILDLDAASETLAANAAGDAAGDIVDAFQKEKSALDQFRREVETAVSNLKDSGKKETLVFFIDELDRCRPTFAIEMLERIKHLFDVANIVFVLSVDKKQLEASTAAVYGERINAAEYLRRFIDLEYGIPLVQTKKFTKKLLTRFELDPAFSQRTGHSVQYDHENFVDVFTELADLFDLSLRARERCVTCLAVVMDQTPSNHYLDPILAAFLLVLRLRNQDLFHALCKGSASSVDAMKYLKSLPGGGSLVADRTGVVIEAYLLAGDPNDERKEALHKALQERAEDPKGTSGEHVRARELLAMRKHIPGGMRHRFDLKYVAGKIDLAASIRG